MPDLPRSHLAIYAVAFAAIALLGARQLARGTGAPAAEALARPQAAAEIKVESDAGGGEAVIVHVAGAVRRPGVYRVRAGTRVDDAVRRAGGAERGADLDALNLAAKVEDGRQIVVPARGPREGAQTPALSGGASGVAGTSPGGGPVDLNTATLEQLDTLDGVGPGIAQKILDFREERGGFTSVEELGEIPGIGEKRLASLRAQVTV